MSPSCCSTRSTPSNSASLCEVFGLDRCDEGLPVHDFAVVSAEGAGPAHHAGFTISTPHGLDRLEEADLIAVPAGQPLRGPGVPRGGPRRPAPGRGARGAGPERLLRRLRPRRGGAAGRPPLHHPLAARRRSWPAAIPEARVEPDVLYVDEGPVITSAGTAAGIDACLHLVRQAHGPAVANAIARRMVVPPAPGRRPGPVHQAPAAPHRVRHRRRTRSPGWSATWTRR